MNRSDMQSLARIVIFAIAVYIAASQFIVVLLLPLTLLTEFGLPELRDNIPFLLMIPVWLIVISLLLRYSDRIVAWLFGPPSPDDSSRPEPGAACLPAAFRIACLLGGFAFLYRMVNAITSSLGYLIAKGSRQGVIHQWSHTVTALVILAIGIYLLCGAPHFVRWHVKKTLEMFSEKQDNAPTGPETPRV